MTWAPAGSGSPSPCQARQPAHPGRNVTGTADPTPYTEEPPNAR